MLGYLPVYILSSEKQTVVPQSCELWRTHDFQGGQIYEHIFYQIEAIVVLCLLSFNHFLQQPQFWSSWGIFSLVTRLDQSRAPENIWGIISRAQLFVVGHYFSWPLSCEDKYLTNLRAVFEPDRGYYVYHPSNIFRNTRGLKNCGISIEKFPVSEAYLKGKFPKTQK